MRTYETPRLTAHGNIHSITGFTGASGKQDFAWGPTGEAFNDADDQGSVNYCGPGPQGPLVPCDAPAPQV